MFDKFKNMKISKFLLLCSLQFGALSLQANEQEEIAVAERDLPKLPEQQIEKKAPILIEECRGLILAGSPHDFLEGSQLRSFDGFAVVGLNLPGPANKLESRLSPLYLDKPITRDTIIEIKNVINNFYQDYKHPLMVVEVPVQDVTSGILQLLVLESCLGEVKVEGNKWFKSEHLKEYISLQPGEPIDQGVLLNDVNFLNRNPFRRVGIIYAPGEEPMTTDVILSTEDRRTWRAYMGTDNDGVELIGEERWFGGINFGNLWNAGHIFSYQYTAAYNINRFQAHTAQYIAPLPWQHILDIYGGYSKVRPKLTTPMMRNSGWSAQGSLRYTVPLQVYEYLEHEVKAGFDYKRTNNTFEFTEDIPTFGKNVNLTQAVFGYTGNYERDTYRIDFNGEIFWSPGKWISDQTDADYNSLRPGAVNHWVYFKGSFVYLQRLPKAFSLSLLAKGQISSQNLLPSEQYGLGGYATVRGYVERETNKDSAINLSGELRTPAFRLMRGTSLNDALQFLVFMDYGWGTNHNAIPGEPKTQYLLGAGPGMRYTVEPYLTARVDWGFKLHRSASFSENDYSRIYFSLVASY